MRSWSPSSMRWVGAIGWVGAGRRPCRCRSRWSIGGPPRTNGRRHSSARRVDARCCCRCRRRSRDGCCGSSSGARSRPSMPPAERSPASRRTGRPRRGRPTRRTNPGPPTPRPPSRQRRSGWALAPERECPGRADSAPHGPRTPAAGRWRNRRRSPRRTRRRRDSGRRSWDTLWWRRPQVAPARRAPRPGRPRSGPEPGDADGRSAHVTPVGGGRVVPFGTAEGGGHQRTRVVLVERVSRAISSRRLTSRRNRTVPPSASELDDP